MLLYFINVFIYSARKTYSLTNIECPTVSDYQKYGELHILRCSLECPIQTSSNCEPVTVECGKCCSNVLFVILSIL